MNVTVFLMAAPREPPPKTSLDEPTALSPGHAPSTATKLIWPDPKIKSVFQGHFSEGIACGHNLNVVE